MGRPSKRAQKIRTADEFNAARLRADLATPTGTGHAIYSWSLEDIYGARDEQLRGQFRRPAAMAESMRTDDAIMVAYENRLDPQRCTKVEIVPASDKGKAVSIANEAEALYGQDGIGVTSETLADVNGCLVDHGVAFGCCSVVPRDDGSRLDMFMRYWPIENVRWDDTIRSYVTRVDEASVADGELRAGTFGGEIPITHGDGRWVVFAKHEYKPWTQEAAILASCLVWARHAFATRDWAKSSVAHGNAKVVGEMAENVPLQNEDGSLTQEAAAMVELLRAIASADAPVGLRPSGSKTDFLANGSTAWQVFSELVLNAGRAAARIYLGTDGVLGAQGGAPGVDIGALFGVAATKVQGDLGCIERCMRTGVLEPWAAMNFGDSSLAPRRRYLIVDPDEEARRATVGTRRSAFYADIASARANGFTVDQSFVEQTAREYDVTPPVLPAVDDKAAKAPTIALAPTDLARVVTVNEARASAGIGDLLLADGKSDPDGKLTVEQFAAKKAAEAAAQAAAASAPPAGPPALRVVSDLPGADAAAE